ncbi:MAG: DUF4231 domain-containing protein [Nitrospiraceae bacterium]
MTTTDYPALFCASDKASLRAQAAYFRILWAQLFSLILAGITAKLASAVGPSSYRVLANATAAILAVGLLLMWVLRAKRYEKVWFDCRAVAESVKTATWRYMMQAPPYDRDEDEAHVDTGFLKDLGDIRGARPGVDAHLAGLVSGATQISDCMRRTRVLPLDERKKIYLRDRLVDQKTWYDGKARANRSSASAWFWTVAGLQVVALCLAIVQSDALLMSIDPVPIIMAVAAALVAWTQAKRHDELTQSYSLAAQELSSLEALAPHASDPKSLQAFVTQAEEAISREHTLWMARRNI